MIFGSVLRPRGTTPDEEEPGVSVQVALGALPLLFILLLVGWLWGLSTSSATGIAAGLAGE